MIGTPGSSSGPSARRGATDLLIETAELGGYFALASLRPGEGANLASLMVDAATVSAFVERTRSAIAASMKCDQDRIPVRMAASSFQLNVVSRLISPVVGAAAAFGQVPLLTPESVRWQATGGHTPRFGTTHVDWAPAPTARRAAELISESILDTIVGPLNDTLRSTVSLSGRVCWGNTISATNGAVTVMAMRRPDLEQSGRGLVRALLEVGPLMNTGTMDGGRFVRRSCCLFYQAPGSGLCQDCVLSVPDGSRRAGEH